MFAVFQLLLSGEFVNIMFNFFELTFKIFSKIRPLN